VAPTQLAEIGYVVKTHGVKGHLKITFKENCIELSTGKALFFLSKGTQVPYFISHIEYIADQEAIVLVEDVNSPELAERFTKKPVWGDAAFLEAEEETDDSIDYAGYIVVDDSIGEIGPVTGLYQMSDYDLLEVTYMDREVMIPFHEDTILEIDDDKRVITMKLPDGILEL